MGGSVLAALMAQARQTAEAGYYDPVPGTDVQAAPPLRPVGGGGSSDDVVLLAELKPSAPSAGDLRRSSTAGFPPRSAPSAQPRGAGEGEPWVQQRLRDYRRGGASALSVLTEPHTF